MAVIANQNQNDQQNQQQKGQNSLNPLQTVGTAAPSGQGPSGSPQAQQQSSALASQQQSGSGRFTNLQKYLQANQGGSQRIAQNIENQYNKQAQAVNQGIQQAQGTLNNQVNPLQQQLGTQGEQQINQGFQDPNAVLNDQSALTNFKNLYGGLGQNINNIAGTQNLQQQQLNSQLSNLQNTAGLAGTEQGRFQLLRNSVNAPDYTQGAQRLDQTLLQSQPSITNNLQTGLQGIANQTGQNLSGLNQDTISKINALKGLSQDRQDQWNTLLNNGTDNGAGTAALNQQGLNDISSNVQNQYNQMQQNLPGMQNAYQQAFANNNFTDDQLKALGLSAGQSTWELTPAQLQQIGGFSMNQLSDYANGGAAQTASQDQMDRYNALRQLAGTDQSTASIFGQSQQAGGFNPINFNQRNVQQAIANAKSNVQVGQVNAIIDQMRNSGYFNGASSGGGMRAADPGAPYRQAVGSTLANLQNQYNNGQISADDYYNQVSNAVQNIWRSAGISNIYGQGGLYGQLGNQANVIGNAQNQTINGGNALPTNKDGTINWGAITAPQGK